MINYVKGHTMILAFILQADINQIFQMRYCMLLWVKRLQKYQRSKLEVEKNLPESAISYRPPTLTSDIFAAS